MRAARAHGERVLFVLGPAVVHTAARESIASLIRLGYIQVIFGGNAIVTHDVEAAMFGTSLGINLHTGEAVEHGHRNHLRAINAVRALGSLEAAREKGLLGEGIVAAALEHHVELVLAGSIRDDGPMPGVITDTMAAQGAMRRALHGVEVCVMVASMLHGIATGNLLPAAVHTVVVDISPAVVTKLSDRGTAQAVGLVTDAELFLSALAAALA
jgi:lysine-ketoglutarate reductase/saccharopine dehydrogenase-like protein (TIGR00300 family)